MKINVKKATSQILREFLKKEGLWKKFKTYVKEDWADGNSYPLPSGIFIKDIPSAFGCGTTSEGCKFWRKISDKFDDYYLKNILKDKDK